MVIIRRVIFLNNGQGDQMKKLFLLILISLCVNSLMAKTVSYKMRMAFYLNVGQVVTLPDGRRLVVGIGISPILDRQDMELFEIDYDEVVFSVNGERKALSGKGLLEREIESNGVKFKSKISLKKEHSFVSGAGYFLADIELRSEKGIQNFTIFFDNKDSFNIPHHRLSTSCVVYNDFECVGLTWD